MTGLNRRKDKVISFGFGTIPLILLLIKSFDLVTVKIIASQTCIFHTFGCNSHLLRVSNSPRKLQIIVIKSTINFLKLFSVLSIKVDTIADASFL